jgi:hypothetical protein
MSRPAKKIGLYEVKNIIKKHFSDLKDRCKESDWTIDNKLITEFKNSILEDISESF